MHAPSCARRPVNSLSSKTRQLIDASLHSASGGEEFPSVFLIDVTGSTADRAMNNAIAHLLEEPIFLRILGSYEL
jgi:prephenate dehydratase